MSRTRFLLPVALAVVTLAFTTFASAQSADPPDRVARLAYLSGDVQFAPAGESTWGSADVNRPLVTGDRLLTGSDGRAALELGDAALRINDNSAFNFLELNDTTSQVELSQGAVNLRVRSLQNGQTYEIDTPTAAFVASQPGTYRVDVDPSGNGAMVTVFDGAGTVYGENGANRPVAAGQSYRFDDPTLANVTVNGLPTPDDFDRFASARDTRYTNSPSRRYVSADVIGYDDLDQYGDWQPTPDYGNVWYPSHVAADWAPYRDGHWAWVDPYGWTWIDNEPWGFAPFHYGRWAQVRDRWGWVPGPPLERAVYAPALVAFVGGSGVSLSINIGGEGNGYGGGPIGWFPLGPRDIYRPPYRVSRDYFNNVNITNIRNVYVNKTVINNYYNGYAANPYAAAPTNAYA
ncbi:MAG: FecR family protein, partial [Rhodanobacteraceae bacterium]